MGIESAKNGKLLYHLTKLQNLESILEQGLAPRKTLIETGVIFEDVADPVIISKRTELGLDSYTPFHFHPYSSFDVAVKNTYSDTKFIYICVARNIAKQNEFKILPKHPLSIEDCVLRDYDDGFEEIDWDILTQKGLTDDYSKQVKMAECLTEKLVSAKLFTSINVKDKETKKLIEGMLKDRGLKSPPYVNIQKWF